MNGSEVKNRNFFGVAIFLIVAALSVFLDRITKLAFQDVPEGQVTENIIPGLLQFDCVHNTGAAWGMFGEWTNIFVLIALVVCIGIVILVFTKSKDIDPVTALSLGFLFAGALSNAIDRVMLGYVVDFLEVTFINFPVFNVADVSITIGVVLLLVSVFFPRRQAI